MHDFYQISLKLILKNNKGEVLILKALDNGTFAGFYDFPGGRIDENEFNTDLTKVVEREVREEIGEIDFEVNSNPVAVGRHNIRKEHSGPYDRDVHVMYIFFEGVYKEGEIKISPEHTDIEWVNLDGIDLKKYFTSGILDGIVMYLQK